MAKLKVGDRVIVKVGKFVGRVGSVVDKPRALDKLGGHIGVNVEFDDWTSEAFLSVNLKKIKFKKGRKFIVAADGRKNKYGKLCEVAGSTWLPDGICEVKFPDDDSEYFFLKRTLIPVSK